MLTEQTMEKMISMKLYKMAESFKERISRTDHRSLDKSEFIGLLVDDEYQDRQNKKMASRLRTAKFKEVQACIEDVDYKCKRGLLKKDMLELAQHHWIKKHQNISFTGPAGVGKSYLAQALGNNACRAGFSVLYTRVSKLLLTLITSRADGTYVNKMKKISKTDVLILDDFGITPLEEQHKQDLFEIIEDRHGVGSTVLTAQLPTEHWHEYLGGGMIGDGICDRLLHNCHKLKLQGESYRKKASNLTHEGHSDKS
ncbi:MAG: IS21-like element helper ATPase IstB [Bdellovibrionales bacterium]|nr:IS21-like element helper ATPase IstB [Bdellovibrionales bacterium]